MTEDSEEITEAQVAEANEDDDDQDPVEPETTDEDEAQEEETPPAADTEPDSYAVSEAHAKEWDRVRRYLAKNLGEIEGDDAVHYTECPVCNSFGTPGFVLPIQPPPEVMGVLQQWMGIRAEDEYMKDEFARQCEKCAGLGETLSGSKVPGRERVTCVPCQGRGWVPVGTERAGGFSPLPNGHSAAYPPEPAADTPQLLTTGPEPPEVQELRAKGYTVIQPFTTGAAS